MDVFLPRHSRVSERSCPGRSHNGRTTRELADYLPSTACFGELNARR